MEHVLPTDPLQLSIAQLAEQVREGAISAERVAVLSLERARETAALGGFIHLSEAPVLERARELDRRRAEGGALGPLAGVPLALKDALCTLDAPTTAASRMLTRPQGAQQASAAQGFCPPFDATVVSRLRSADALLVGKANMDEFAMGSSNENSAFGVARNPADPSRTPGGSSGGSAVCVASGATLGSLGSDTGGSIRQPASLCGVVGVKPSYGRVSRYGLIAFGSSLDQVGPMARDVRGAARLLSVIAGPDALDATCAPWSVPDFEASCGLPVRGLRVGVPKQYFDAGLHPAVRESVEQALAALEAEGCERVELDLPLTHYGISTYYLIATAEASSNLSRYDGVRYGLRVEPEHGDIHAMYAATRGVGFGREVKRRIMLGTYALSAGYYDAYYGKAQRVRTLIRREFAAAFQRVDVIAAPVSPTPAWPLGQRRDDPLAAYLEDVYTVPANLAGLCGVAVPAQGHVTQEGATLPIGLQLLGPPAGEARVLQVAAAWEALHRSPPDPLDTRVP